MKIEEKQELNEENLNTFITEREGKITKAKDVAITKLQKRVNRLQKDQATEEGNDNSKEVDVLSEAIAFLRDIPPDKLMSSALLDQKVFSEDYSNSEATAEQRAIFKFASMNSIQPVIHLFHEQYPDWKNAGENLGLKMELSKSNAAVVTDESKKKKKKKKNVAIEEQNNNIVHTELTNGAGTNGVKKKKIKKKDGKKKQNVNSEVEFGLTNGAVVNGEEKRTKKKKNKLGLKRKGELTENVEDNEGGEVPPKKFKKSSEDSSSAAAMEIDNSKNKAKTKNPKKKKKLNAIEKLMSKCENNPDALMSSLAEISSPSVKSKEKANDGVGFDNNNKFNTSPNTPISSNFNNTPDTPSNNKLNTSPNSNFYTPNAPKYERSPNKGWQEGKHNSFNNRFRGANSSRGSSRGKGNNGPLPAWKIYKITGKGSANAISVSDDWKKLADAPKEEGSEKKESLLRPSWLTNPEEYKPSPMKFGGHGRNNFQREPSSANKIRISSDWRDKLPLKKDDTESTTNDSSGSSLLKPTWLTNPENNPPPPSPSFSKFGDNGRGRGRGRGWGRGRGRGKKW